ncbi:hypothetical protein LL946_01580 [Knoellia locipacati]|uniref:hypothetical protein n=1 Tax=Knoellia locipacati TaxID=882824 RepID=UPI00384E173E
MRGPVPGDPASLSSLGATARRATRDLEAARVRSETAYGSLKDGWGTSTSVRVRKEGGRALATLAEGARHAEAVGAALQSYAVELSELQARARAAVDEASAAGLVVDAGQVQLAWGVTGEADSVATHERTEAVRRLQAELDAISTQHRRRRDRFLTEVVASTANLEALASALRLA